MSNTENSLKMTVYACLFAALTIIGAKLTIPMVPVPITLSNFFILLGGFLLGKKWGTLAAAVYLLLGAAGLPVFTKGGGLTYLLGPTGGYLLGYLPAAFVIGLITEKAKSISVISIAGITAGALIIYLTGIPWLKISMDLAGKDFSWYKAFSAGMLPFLIGDILKCAAAYSLGNAVIRLLPGVFRQVKTGAAD
jgi:biotin transport system substrate-specific component